AKSVQVSSVRQSPSAQHASRQIVLTQMFDWHEAFSFVMHSPTTGCRAPASVSTQNACVSPGGTPQTCPSQHTFVEQHVAAHIGGSPRQACPGGQHAPHGPVAPSSTWPL